MSVILQLHNDPDFYDNLGELIRRDMSPCQVDIIFEVHREQPEVYGAIWSTRPAYLHKPIEVRCEFNLTLQHCRHYPMYTHRPDIVSKCERCDDTMEKYIKKLVYYTMAYTRYGQKFPCRLRVDHITNIQFDGHWDTTSCTVIYRPDTEEDPMKRVERDRKWRTGGILSSQESLRNFMRDPTPTVGL